MRGAEPGAGAPGARRGVARARVTAVGAALLVAAACTGGYGYTDPVDLAFEPEMGIDLETMTLTPSGLYFEDLRVGTGAVAGRGDTVSIRFREYLPTGNLLQNSIDDGEPTVFGIGGGRVIAAWELGVQGMREGGLRRLVAPPQLAYGDLGSGRRIPADQVLVYEVLLEDVR